MELPAKIRKAYKNMPIEVVSISPDVIRVKILSHGRIVVWRLYHPDDINNPGGKISWLIDEMEPIS